MNKICKTLGAIATVGATAIAGTLLYRKGYDKGFDKALRRMTMTTISMTSTMMTMKRKSQVTV